MPQAEAAKGKSEEMLAKELAMKKEGEACVRICVCMCVSVYVGRVR